MSSYQLGQSKHKLWQLLAQGPAAAHLLQTGMHPHCEGSLEKTTYWGNLKHQKWSLPKPGVPGGLSFAQEILTVQLLVIIEKQGPSPWVQELGISRCWGTVPHHTQLEAQSPW